MLRYLFNKDVIRRTSRISHSVLFLFPSSFAARPDETRYLGLGLYKMAFRCNISSAQDQTVNKNKNKGA